MLSGREVAAAFPQSGTVIDNAARCRVLDDTMTNQDLRVPPSNHFEKLRGTLKGYHSIRVNRQERKRIMRARRVGETA